MNWLPRLTQSHPWLRRAPRLFKRGRVPILLAWTLLVFGATQTDRFAAYLPIQKLEQSRLDWRFLKRGNQPGHPDVVLVGVTASSLDPTLLAEFQNENEALALMQQPWPWPRRVWALLIDRLMELGAKTVALDLVFTGEREGNADLAAMVAKYPGRIVLGSTMSTDRNEAIRSAQTFLRPDPAITGPDFRSMVGYCFFTPELDNVIRRVSYRTSELREFGIPDDTRDLTGFAALAYEKFTGRAAPDGYNQPINFQGPPATYPVIPVEQVFVDRLLAQLPPEQRHKPFRDKLVFVGPVAEIFHDVQKTPFGKSAEATPGVEIHAQVAGALLKGTPLRDAPPWAGRLLTLAAALGALGCVLVTRRAFGQSALLLLLGTALTAGTQFAFSGALTIIPVAGAEVALAFVGVFGVIFTFTTEQLEKFLIRGVLDRYVSKNVANLVVSHADQFAEMLRGEKRPVTVLFSDIRGFTGIFESSDPTALVDQLNEYFRAMVTCIHQQGGTLQKFIGDAIVAVWGDVESLGPGPDAARALRAALAMRPALATLNEGWTTASQRVPLRIGIGLNHGEVVVGEVGSPDRKEFTVLGDAVNTAARFETATKQYGVDLLVGGGIEELTRGQFLFRRVDKARLKGKAHPVECFAVLGEVSMAAPPWLERWHEALAHYRAQRWDDATALLQAVDAEQGGLDPLCKLYLARIEALRATPPPADWDGAHTFTEK